MYRYIFGAQKIGLTTGNNWWHTYMLFTIINELSYSTSKKNWRIFIKEIYIILLLLFRLNVLPRMEFLAWPSLTLLLGPFPWLPMLSTTSTTITITTTITTIITTTTLTTSTLGTTTTMPTIREEFWTKSSSILDLE